MFKVWYQELEELPYLVGQYKTLKLAKEGGLNFANRITSQVNESWMWLDEDGIEEVAANKSVNKLVNITL